MQGVVQLPLFVPKSDWRTPRLSELPSWRGAQRVSIDTETYDPHLTTLGPGVRRGAHMVGYSVAIEDGPSFYVPLRHPDSDNCDEAQALAYLRDNARNFDGIVAGAKLDYDLDFMAEQDILFPCVKKLRDVQLAEPLIDELQMSYSLDSISQKYLGHGKNEAVLREAAACYRVDPKKGLWQLPAKFVGAYAESDAADPLKILRRQERVIDEQDLWQVYDLECDVLPVLVKMRRRGVRVDQEHLAYVERYCIERQNEWLARVRHKTGVDIPRQHVMNAELLSRALKTEGIPIPLTAKTRKPSVGKDLFARHKGNEVVDAIAEARRYHKIVNDFVGSIRRHMVKGRIHTTFNQLRRSKEEEDETGEEQEGGRFGRLSSCDPNLQQQPARDKELGPLWRRIYLPDEGMLWASCDYSQQEPRMVVHFAVLARGLITDIAWRRALQAARQYTDDPTTDNHQMMADMAGIERKAAKEIFLGLCYGMGGAKLCRKLGLPTMMAVYDREARGLIPVDTERGRMLVQAGGNAFEAAGPEGQALLNRFDHEVPFVKQLAKACEKRAKEVGHITTLLGRRCRFPEISSGLYDWTHKALNRLIQGSSADQTKLALVQLDRAGHYVQLQIHDEIAASVPNREVANDIGRIMCDCVPLQLPSKVDVEIGPSWGEAA